MRILSVTQLKPIQIGEGFIFPISHRTSLTLDKKNPASKKQHQLFYQQGASYGNVGDCCTTLSNEQLLELEEKGMIKILKTK